ncbi:9073_t:CDS:2, partial [Gigaspora rosea]
RRLLVQGYFSGDFGKSERQRFMKYDKWIPFGTTIAQGLIVGIWIFDELEDGKVLIERYYIWVAYDADFSKA